MNIIDIINFATNKNRFKTIDNFIDFCSHYLEYIDNNLQAIIVSQNENRYQFFQYDHWGDYKITRPINSNLFYKLNDFEQSKKLFRQTLKNAKSIKEDNKKARTSINNTVYTIQQSIGASLDALPPGESNKAKKLNGDLFEHFIRLIIKEIGIDCESGVVKIPIIVNKQKLFDMSFQHDLIVKENYKVKILATIKTSSKDRLDKMFVDKFMYNKLTNTDIPHVAIILNDVQRKRGKPDKKYGINSTFLPGHFKGYTVKLNPLDGVYYCDIRPNMLEDDILKDHITTLDNLICDDIWDLI